MSRRQERVDVEWETRSLTHDDVQLEVLMDIRAELRKLNALLHCSNFVEIPHTLRGIRRNTTKRKRAKGR